jgi:hypothetical protein
LCCLGQCRERISRSDIPFCRVSLLEPVTAARERSRSGEDASLTNVRRRSRESALLPAETPRPTKDHRSICGEAVVALVEAARSDPESGRPRGSARS